MSFRRVAVPGAIVLAAIVLALTPAAGASGGGARMETFMVSYNGYQILDYQSNSPDAFGSGCANTENGSNVTSWFNVNTVKLEVQGQNVTVKSVKYLGGPDVVTWTPTPRSEISGTNSNVANSTYCSDNQEAGQYDCTADWQPALSNSQDAEPMFQRQQTRFIVGIGAYTQLKANYTGQAPAQYPCGSAVGSNNFPGGFVASGISGAEDAAAVPVKYSTLANLPVGHYFRVKVSRYHYMPNPAPAEGTSCAGSSGSGGGGSCTISSSVQYGLVRFKRTS